MATRTVLVSQKGTASAARNTFWAIASEDITLGDVVCFDISKAAGTRADGWDGQNGDYKYVLRSDIANINSAVPAGVALSTVDSGAVVEVCFWGEVAVRVDGTTDIVAGDHLIISAAAGVAITQTLDPTSAALLKASLKAQEIGIALEAYTDTAIVTKSVFVRLPRPD